MTFITKILNDKHYQQFKDLRLMHLELEPQSIGTTLADFKAANKEQIAALFTCNNTPSSDFVLGIFDKNQLVGMLGFRREVRKSSLRHKASFWGFFVMPKYRNQGVGAQLIEDALAIVQQYKWCEMIRIMLSVEDKIVLHLANKFGFTSYGLEKHSRKINGIYYDDIFLNKFL